MRKIEITRWNDGQDDLEEPAIRMAIFIPSPYTNMKKLQDEMYEAFVSLEAALHREVTTRETARAKQIEDMARARAAQETQKA